MSCGYTELEMHSKCEAEAYCKIQNMIKGCYLEKF